MHGLYKMPRAIRAQMIHTRVAVELGSYRFGHGFELGPAVRTAAHHHRRPAARALGTARDTHAHKMRACAFQTGKATAGVVKVCIPTVDNCIATLQQRQHGINHRIHRRAGGDHKQDGARGFQRCDKLSKRVYRHKERRQRARFLDKCGYPVHLTVGHGNPKAAFGKVQGQRTAHCAQSVDADISFVMCHGGSCGC